MWVWFPVCRDSLGRDSRLGGESLSTVRNQEGMLVGVAYKSVRAIGRLSLTERLFFDEGPLWEVPLYSSILLSYTKSCIS